MRRAGLTSLIVPTRDRAGLLGQLIHSLERTVDTTTTPVELIVVDNQSKAPETEALFDSLREPRPSSAFERVRIVPHDRPFNYSSINNLASLYAHGDALLFLNNDVEAIHGGWLGHMLEELARPDTGVVGAKLYFPDDTVQHAGITLGHERIAGHTFKRHARACTGPDDTLARVREVSAVTGACLLIRTAVFHAVGGFDTQLAVAFNDVDLCLRVSEAGYRVIWTPDAELYHHESVSRGGVSARSYRRRFLHRREIRYMERKWGERLRRDPFAPPGADTSPESSSGVASSRSQAPERRSEPSLIGPDAKPLVETSETTVSTDDGFLDVRASVSSADADLDQRDLPQPTVAVALCTHNGERFLGEQIESLARQSWPISVTVFDDGSKDRTRRIVDAWRSRIAIDWLPANTNLGFVGNFERAIRHLSESGHSYIALCDQDDVWKPNRIEMQMRDLLRAERLVDRETPILVHADLEVIDARGRLLNRSFLAGRGYVVDSRRDLGRILGQNGVMGNTILMNAALAELAVPFPNGVHAHDYWLAVLAELYGQRLFIDRALVRYRIHDENTSNRQMKFARRGSLRPRSLMTLARARRRDFRLPYREDSRVEALESLLAGDGKRPQLSCGQRDILDRFLGYLRDDRSRVRTLAHMLRGTYLRPQLSHRLRFMLAHLATRRYRSTRGRH